VNQEGQTDRTAGQQPGMLEKHDRKGHEHRRHQQRLGILEKTVSGDLFLLHVIS
jgi:hypothetical protein